MKQFQTLVLQEIHISEQLRMRASVDAGVVAEYAAAAAEGERFPPVVVYYDGSTYWLADGFQRFEAYRRAAVEAIECEVRPGGFSEALLCACGANASHGMRRTNADKRKAVRTMLEDQEWSKWSDREIARTCAVSHPFVIDLRKDGKRQVVPEKLRAVFFTARAMRKCGKLLARCRAILGKIATLPGGEYLSNDFLARLDSLCEELRGATPYVVCPAYHIIAHTRCELCGEAGPNARGYLPRRGYAALNPVAEQPGYCSPVAPQPENTADCNSGNHTVKAKGFEPNP